MSKKAVILHGTNGDPDNCWHPWLKKQLEAKGYEVFVPLLPDNDRPNKQTYDKFLRESGWDFENNLIVGHSSGATTVLNLLSEDWFPKVDTAILVGVFLNEKLTKSVDWYQDGQFDELFVTKFDPEQLKTKVERFYFVHGDDDPYCDYEDAKMLCEQLNGNFISVKGGKHFTNSSGAFELPMLTERLLQDKVI